MLNRFTRCEYVETMPWTLEEGVFYVSEKYKLASHMCPCGCGNEAVLPLREDTGWVMTKAGDKVTLSPSILHTGCKAHYFVRDNEIVWA